MVMIAFALFLSVIIFIYTVHSDFNLFIYIFFKTHFLYGLMMNSTLERGY